MIAATATVTAAVGLLRVFRVNEPKIRFYFSALGDCKIGDCETPRGDRGIVPRYLPPKIGSEIEVERTLSPLFDVAGVRERYE